MQDEPYPTAICLHGLTLDADDAARLTRTAVEAACDYLDRATTFTAYTTAAGYLATALRDALTLGANMGQLTAWTDYPAEVLVDVLANGFKEA